MNLVLFLNFLPLNHLFIYKVFRIFYIKCDDTKDVQNEYSRRLRLYNKHTIPRLYTEDFKRSYDLIGPL